MFSLKIIGAFLIIIACYMYGELMYLKLKDRLYILKELHKVGRVYKATIRHSGGDVEEVLDSIYHKVGDEIKLFIKDIVEKIKIREEGELSIIWLNSVRDKLKPIGLKEEELLVVNRFGETLGYIDREMQIESTDVYLQEMEEIIDLLAEEIQKKTKLYKTLSLSCGVLIVLLII